MAKRHKFRLAVKYPEDRDITKRPPLPIWLAPDKDLRNATVGQLRSFEYWTQIYWATPPWITKEMILEMKGIYESTTKKEHVDHIVPLKGKTVCGLHVPWNLQKLPEKTNLAKSNDIWPDSWTEPMTLGLDHTPHQLSLGI